METTVKEKIINGVDLGAFNETIEQIVENPEIAKFQFRAKNRWVKGTHSTATVKDFYAALQEDDTRAPVDFELDEPPVFLGNNIGNNPAEYLLVALSGCMTTVMIVQAANMGIRIDGIESRYEADIDARGLLGLTEEVPVEFQAIKIYFKIDADISDEKKEELIELGRKYSPVYNTISKSIPVSVTLER